MEKQFLNQRELGIVLGLSKPRARETMNYLLKIMKDGTEKYYVPETIRMKLVPTRLVKKEFKIKGEVKLDE